MGITLSAVVLFSNVGSLDGFVADKANYSYFPVLADMSSGYYVVCETQLSECHVSRILCWRLTIYFES